MRNWIIKFFMCICFIILIMSCSFFYGKKLNNQILISNKFKENNKKNKTIINMWVKKDKLLETRKYQINKFNNENKDNIRVVLNYYDKDYYNVIRTSLINDKGPDIFEYSGDRILFEKGKILNLKDLNLDITKINSNYLFKYEGGSYGVNLMGNNVKLIWNKEIFKNSGLNPNTPPKTWQDVVKFAKKIKRIDHSIIPLEISLNSNVYEDLRVYIGLPSVVGKDIYTSFWDYNKGMYDFTKSKDILKIYNYMYKNNLMNRNFQDTNRNGIKLDFYSNKVGMMLSTFEDKDYFSNVVPLNFEIGISDIPKINLNDKEKFYYVNNSQCFLINRNVVKNKNKSYAVKKFYQWILSEDINKEILKTKKALPIILKDKSLEKDIYKEYNDTNNFTNEQYDPTKFISHNFANDYKIFSEAIKGTKNLDDSIKELNKIYELNCKIITDRNILNLNNYIQK